jgi:rhamnogalacturonyl hydrolase YesR
MHAAAVEPERGWPYVKAAVAQLRAYIDVFLNRHNGLAHTILGPKGLGKTHWCRAQGWLMWSFIAVMRGLAAEDSAMPQFRRELEFFADGVARTVDGDGAIHAFADDPTTPQETSGTAMVAIGLHESVRRGWLEGAKYDSMAQRMWRFCREHITPDGGMERVYTEWALPAELYVESSKTLKFGPHIGALLWLADETTRPTDA